MEKDQSNILCQRVFIGTFILMIIPFLILFIYTNPSPEDFYYAHEAKVRTLWENMRAQYKFVSGRYSQNFLLYLTPAFVNTFVFYKAACFLFMVSFFSSILLAVSLLTKKFLSLSERSLISFTVLFSYLYAMPEVSSGIFWYGGLTAYHSGIILIPLFFAFLTKSENSASPSAEILFTMLTLIILIMITGVNEILAMLMFLLTLFLNARHFIITKKIRWQYLLYTLASVIFLYILMKSPGNQIRLTRFPNNRDLEYSLISSAVYLYKNIFSWIFQTPLLPCTLILLPVYFKISDKFSHFKSNSFIAPLWFFILWMTVLFICVFFSFYSATIVLDRTSNFIFFMFLAGWFYMIFVLSILIHSKHKVIYNKYSRYFCAVSFIFILLFMMKQNNVATAFSDLFSGAAYNYNRQLNERYQFIIDCQTDSCKVDSLIKIPKTLYYKDLTTDPESMPSDWYNKFFNKKSIFLNKQKVMVK